jgi:hypothetical protein
MDFNREKIRTVSVSLLVILILLAALPAHAASNKAAQVKAEWNRVICIAIKALQLIAIGLAVIVLIVAGVKYMSSADDTDARDGAKKIIMQTVGSLVLVIVAVTVVNYLITGTDISRFDMNVCSDIFPATTMSTVTWPPTTSGTTTTTGTGTSTTGTGTSTTGVSPTTTTTPVEICLDPANKYSIPNSNACQRACSISPTQCKQDLDKNGIYDIDQICGAGFKACCCRVDPVAYAYCCLA